MSAYADFYQPLPVGKWIRLLYLQPGQGGASLAAELAHVELGPSTPVYGAISYVWGNPNVTETMICNGIHFQITVSLADALRQVRSETAVQALWADAVCINQHNIDEKEHQVNMMGVIYRSAWIVFICIGGDEHGDIDSAFSLIEDVNSRFEDHIEKWSDGFQTPSVSSDDPLVSPARWDAVANLFRRPWFSRIWVLQEVGLAVRATLFCGQHCIPWSKVLEFAILAHLHKDLIALGVRVAYGRLITAFDLLWRSYLKGVSWMGERPMTRRMTSAEATAGRNSLLNTLAVGFGHAATDPRDFIYAFLSHPSTFEADSSQPFLAADYKISKDELYRKVATYLLRHETPPLAVLTAARATTETINGPIPSWIPCWDDYRDSTSLGLLAKTARRYDASRFSETSKECIAEAYHLEQTRPVPVEQSSLRVHGLTVGCICATSGVMHLQDTFRPVDPQPSDASPQNTVELALIEAGVLNSFGSPHTPYENPLRAIALTFTAGRDPMGHFIQSDAEIDADFAAFCLANCSRDFYKRLSDACSGSCKAAVASTEAKDGNEHRYFEHIHQFCQGYRFIVTKTGHYGLAPPFSQPGDLCVVIIGANTPFIVRKVASTRSAAAYKLVGESYLHGFMEGEAVEIWQAGRLQLEDIVFV